MCCLSKRSRIACECADCLRMESVPFVGSQECHSPAIPRVTLHKWVAEQFPWLEGCAIQRDESRDDDIELRIVRASTCLATRIPRCCESPEFRTRDRRVRLGPGWTEAHPTVAIT